MKRRKFSAEFKRKVVVEAMRGDRTMREVAARHGLNPNQIGRWKTEAMDGLLEVFRRGGMEKPGRESEKVIEALYARIGELTVERDFFHRGLELSDGRRG